MNTRYFLFSTILLISILVTACGGAATPDAMMEETPTADTMMDMETPTADAMMSTETQTADDMTMHETPTADAMLPEEMATGEAMMESPAWFGAALTDVRTDTSFTVQDFEGKVVLVEAMAVWCSSCLQQQRQVQALHEMLGPRDDLVTIGLDIDPNEDASRLKGFVDAQGFSWLYAVAPADVSRELASLYGDQFLNPPSTPMLAIDRHGVVHPLPFGIKSAEDLQEFIQPFLDEGM